MLSIDQLVESLLEAARAAQKEKPRVGVRYAHEWAMVSRVAIHWARQPEIVKLEEKGIYVDVDYGQQGRESLKRLGGKRVRIDLILHRRGTRSRNLLACEFKMRSSTPRKVDTKDERKLKALIEELHYKRCIWIAFAKRIGDRNAGCYTIFKATKKGVENTKFFNL